MSPALLSGDVPKIARKRLDWSSISWIAPLTLIVSLVTMYFAWPAFQDFIQKAYEVMSSGDQHRIQSWVRGYGAWGVVVMIGLMFMQAVIAILPSIATMVAAVLAYGPFWGGALAWGGMIMTGTFMYAVGRSLGPVTVERMIGEKTQKRIEKLVERYGSWAIVLARITPASSSDAVSFAAGALKMGYFRFIVAMAAGTLPLTVLIAWLGSDMGRLKTGLIVTSVIAVVGFIGYLIWERRHRHAAGSDGSQAHGSEATSH